MCQRLNTGESNNFYLGIFICIGPLTTPHMSSPSSFLQVLKFPPPVKLTFRRHKHCFDMILGVKS